MNYNNYIKWLLVISLISIGQIGSAEEASAQEQQSNMLIIYSTKTGHVTADVSMLGLLLGHFSEKQTVLSDEEVSPEDVKGKQTIIYYGETKKTLPRQALYAMQQTDAMLIAIGHNAEQLNAFSHLSFTKQQHVYEIQKTKEKHYRLQDDGLTVLGVSGDDLKPQFSFQKHHKKTPFIVQTNKKTTYIGIFQVLQNKMLIAEVFELLFQQEKEKTIKYLRLEDISPVSDEKKLLEVGTYLSERHIPFLLAVIPVFVDPSTGEQITLKDRPKLVNILKKLQDNGGTVILHGHSHSYRNSETGEGLEFWDAKLDQPIISSDTQDAKEKLANQSAFPSEQAYQTYLKSYQENEVAYTEQKLTEGIELLVDQGLYPLAFEAPHYAMSQLGYQVTSRYFSSLFGQVQLTDDTWKTMSAPPYVSTPASLHGMTLYPEQLGYVDPTAADPIGQAEQAISAMQHIQDQIAGAFYHTYLGLEYLPDLISQMESLPQSEWLDLKRTKQTVQTPNVKIETTGNGHIQVHQSKEILTNSPKRSGMEKVLLLLTGVVFLFIVMFILYTLYLRLTMKKRIFKERKTRG
ncbi:DUF2334 domain-containing protein [Bacillus sp. NPDC077027]|uniref:DUF2334 domain-containing protein n=1 Tax=Bacillus sp. NPDC077027 TaxID=3390548 RepID=UPI003D04C140